MKKFQYEYTAVIKLITGFTVVTFLLFCFPFTIKATSTPLLSDPPNSTVVISLPTLTWQVVPGAIQYRVVLDDETTATGANIKNYYTQNTYYSPQLNPGTYYWKVKAKDEGDIWSDWSEIWVFTYNSEQEATPTPTPTETPFESPTSIPTPTFTPTPTCTVTPTPSCSMTPTPIATITPTLTPQPTVTPISTKTPTATESSCPTQTPTVSPQPMCRIIYHPVRLFWLSFNYPSLFCPVKR